MRKIEVELPDEIADALERTAAGRGLSAAEVAREAIEAEVVEHVHRRPRIPLIESGDPTLAERADVELKRGFGE